MRVVSVLPAPMRRQTIPRVASACLALLVFASACGDDDVDVSGAPADEIDEGGDEAADAVDEGEEGSQGDEAIAELHARSIVRLVTVDHSFGDETDPFDLIQIATMVGGDEARPLESLAVETVTAELSSRAELEFIDDPEAVIQDHFESDTTGIAVVTIADVRIDDERAEVEIGLWCGSLCAVGLTYEAVLGPSGWEIRGTTGPIVMS